MLNKGSPKPCLRSKPGRDARVVSTKQSRAYGIGRLAPSSERIRISYGRQHYHAAEAFRLDPPCSHPAQGSAHRSIRRFRTPQQAACTLSLRGSRGFDGWQRARMGSTSADHPIHPLQPKHAMASRQTVLIHAPQSPVLPRRVLQLEYLVGPEGERSCFDRATRRRRR